MQLMQQMLLIVKCYSNSQSNIQNHIIISLSLRLFSDSDSDSQRKKH